MRKKEIEKASICQYQIIGTIGEQEAFKNGFVKGAEWANKTMIEKACKWLINIDFDDFHFRDCDETFNNDLFVDSFRKAMEE